jgi:FkbM family methyltransferase
MLGIGKIMSSASEGLLNLHRAYQLQPSPSHLQALYLGYYTIKDMPTANYWLETARNLCLSQSLEGASWEWTKLSLASPFTYVPFEENLVMAVEPSFRSIVTSVILGQNDWFEGEMEFWRNWLQPEMTVIDVGANAGVYAFSAANKVGTEGLVLAIEPFSECVSYLKETCRINNLNQVKVIAAAASDRNGKAKLKLSSASELNEILTEESSINESYEEVECVTLDSLVDIEGLERIDFLKMDAEGHEIQVLKGSENSLSKFSPVIMYENFANAQSNNLPVADFLIARGYQLFRYQPFLQKLIPINSAMETQGSLNIIAMPKRCL